MREEAHRVACGTQVQTLHALDSRFAQHVLGGGPQVKVSSLDHPRTELCPVRSKDLVANRVTARADPGSDDRRERAAERSDARLHDFLEQPQATRMQEREPSVAVDARERDRQTIGTEGQHRHTGLVGPETVPVLRALPRVGPIHGGGVDLAVQREPFGLDAHRLAEPSPVLVHVLGIVARASSEIERLVGTAADTAQPCREGDRVRPGYFPADQRDTHGSSARARSSNRSRVFSAGSSTTASSSASSAALSSGPSSYPRAIRSDPSTARSASRCGWTCSCSSNSRSRETASSSDCCTCLPCRSASLCATRSPVSRASRRARAGSAPNSSFESSPIPSAPSPPPTRSPETSATLEASARICCSVSASGSRPSCETRRRPRTRRNGSSAKLRGRTVRSTLLFRSA